MEVAGVWRDLAASASVAAALLCDLLWARLVAHTAGLRRVLGTVSRLCLLSVSTAVILTASHRSYFLTPICPEAVSGFQQFQSL